MYTTYSQLDDGSGDNNALLAQVEALTGSRITYGYSTPIQFPDIVNTCGPVTAISCLPYAVQDSNATAQVIGVEMCKLYLDIWNGVFPDDSRPFDLLYFLELIISGQNTILPNRVDYCGRDLGGATLITDNQLNDIIINLQTKIDGLNYIGHFTSYVIYIGNPGPVTPVQLATWRGVGGDPPLVTITDDDVAHPIVDNSQGAIIRVHGIYVERTIAAAIAADQYVSDTFDYDASLSTFYYKTTYHSQAATDQLYDYANTAARWFFLALKTAAEQVINDAGVNLNTIYSYLRNARLDYNNFRQQQIRPALTAVNQLANGLIPIANSGDPALDAAGQTVINAGLVSRASLLRNATYVSHFDVDASNGISATERVTMENDIQTQMKTARQTAGAAISAQYTSQFNQYNSSTDDLAPIIVLYTM